MTYPAAPLVDKTVLGDLTLIGKGGQGRVWATDSIRLNGAWSAAYKQYDPTVLGGLDRAALAEMVAFVPHLPYDTGQWLCERAAWPAALVGEDGRVSGFLMRRIPPEFETRLPHRDGSWHSRPAGLQYLLNPDGYLARMAIPIDDRQRLLLLAHLAGTVAEFHRLGIVVGDLSPNNLLYHLADQPECFFIDCDAMRLAGRSVLRQTETPDWEVPAGEVLATPASDAYKYGLMAIRLFARDQSSRDHTVLGVASGELVALARRSQATDPARRPGPGEWIAALTAAAVTGSTKPPVPSPLRVSASVPVGPQTAVAGPTRSRGYGTAAVVGLIVLLVALILIGVIANH